MWKTNKQIKTTMHSPLLIWVQVSRMSKVSKTSFSPATSSSFSWGTLRYSQSRWDIKSLEHVLGLPWGFLPAECGQTTPKGWCSYSFSHHSKLVTIGNRWNVDGLVNWELCPQAKETKKGKKFPNYCVITNFTQLCWEWKPSTCISSSGGGGDCWLWTTKISALLKSV